MNELKELLFEKTYKDIEKSKIFLNASYAYKFSAFYSFIIEIGLGEEFQKYEKERKNTK